VEAAPRRPLVSSRVEAVRRAEGLGMARVSSSSVLSSVTAFDSLSLRTEPRVELIPIDHGYCLPEMVDAVYFEWLFWPQAAQPFAAAELQYVAALNVRDELSLLRRELPMLREESLRMLEASTCVLQVS
jgi:hypothetical protein